MNEATIEALRTSSFTSGDAAEQIVSDVCRQLLSDEILGGEEFLRYAASDKRPPTPSTPYFARVCRNTGPKRGCREVALPESGR